MKLCPLSPPISEPAPAGCPRKDPRLAENTRREWAAAKGREGRVASGIQASKRQFLRRTPDAVLGGFLFCSDFGGTSDEKFSKMASFCSNGPHAKFLVLSRYTSFRLNRENTSY